MSELSWKGERERTKLGQAFNSALIYCSVNRKNGQVQSHERRLKPGVFRNKNPGRRDRGQQKSARFKFYDFFSVGLLVLWQSALRHMLSPKLEWIMGPEFAYFLSQLRLLPALIRSSSIRPGSLSNVALPRFPIFVSIKMGDAFLNNWRIQDRALLHR